jgi:glutamate racemase
MLRSARAAAPTSALIWDRAIGIFDSGLGGLGVANAVASVLPNEDIVYLADFEHFPYGRRSLKTVEGLTTRAVRFFIGQHVKVILIACNTASAAGLNAAEAAAGRVPVVGMVEPAVRAALKIGRLRRVAVIGTTGTVSSGAYATEFARRSSTLEVVSIACDSLLDYLGEGDLRDAGRISTLIEGCMGPLRKREIDAVVLGCTDLTAIARQLRHFMEPGMRIVDPAGEVALTTRDLLLSRGVQAPLSRQGQLTFYATCPPPPRTRAFAHKAFNMPLGRIRLLKDF